MIPRPVVILVSCLAGIASSAVAAPPLIVPGDDLPPAVAALGALDQMQAFGVSEDGSVAIAAFPSERGGARSVLRIGRADGETTPIELVGEALALAVAAAGNDAFVVVHEKDRKGAVRRVGLLRLDPRSGRMAPQVDLPITARGLAFAPGEAALIVAARNEIRTFLLPGLTSGPMYRVAGENAGVAPVAGTTQLLVSRGAEIVVVDLAAPQSREGLATVESATAPALVRALASAPDAPSAIALLEGGQAVIVETGPLRVTPSGAASAVSWPGAKSVPPPAAPPAAAVAPVAVPPPEAQPPAAEPPVEDSPLDAKAIAPEPSPAIPPPPPFEETPLFEAPAASPRQTERLDAPEGVSGQISGPARSEVREIVFLGPNNVLKEAARVRLDASGNYTASGLPPGSYRVVATGEGGRVLECRPPYITVEVGPQARQTVPTLEVLRSY